MMRNKYISILCFALFSFLAALLQASTVVAQTGTIGTGTGSGLYHGPIYRFSNSSTSNYTKNMMLYTATELQNAGLTVGTQITSLAWYKANEFNLTNGATGVLTISLKDNSTYTTEFPTGANIMNITTTGFTQVAQVQYNTTTNNLPNVAGWVTINLTTPFTYTGGNLEIYCDWVLTPGSGNPSNGAFNWRNHSTNFCTLQMFASAPLQASGTNYRYNLRGDLQIGYGSTTTCSGTPNAGTVTISTGNTVCPGTAVALGLTGHSVGAGITYEWESSTVSGTGGFNSLGTAQTTPANTVYPSLTT